MVEKIRKIIKSVFASNLILVIKFSSIICFVYFMTIREINITTIRLSKDQATFLYDCWFDSLRIRKIYYMKIEVTTLV